MFNFNIVTCQIQHMVELPWLTCTSLTMVAHHVYILRLQKCKARCPRNLRKKSSNEKHYSVWSLYNS